ncbi:hypothetical protein OPKNFCMD_3030 [Methylobacterium crusticola]|uniref:Lipopolysaccharide biosynthesis protein n=1 Tax=Methylobacterium crusticola TaxID=1697972 RepID=A0ABQ4QZ11_9HYPH|nr:oligosaccharide flippase family protein [Methylobacterium crusticola]GJD50291.1 hypothetical protein OPKNFCMD_3030 [Methylobacterium crusticola]
MSGVRRAVLLAAGERGLIGILTLVQTAAISRLLTPEQVGVALIGTAALQVIESLRDFGTTTYLIQQREITRESARTAFTILLLISGLLAAGLVAAAPAFAAAYGQPGLASYLLVLALALAFLPVAAPRMALMRRDLAFGALACANVAGALTFAIVVVTLALAGLGFMSVAWATVASGLATAAVATGLRPDPWMFRPCLAEWRATLRFSGYMTGTHLLNRAYELLPIFVLGRFCPVEAVGLYSRAQVISQLPERLILASVAGVVLPAFAAEGGDRGALRRAYLSGLSYVAVIQWPALVLIAMTAGPVVRLVLGEQWLAAVPLVQTMALATAIPFAAILSGPILVASGGLRDTLTSSLISLPVSGLVVVGAAAFGPAALALSLFVTLPLQVLVVMHLIRRRLDARWGEFARALRTSALVTCASAIPPAALLAGAGRGFDPGLPLAALAAAGALGGWLAGVALLGHPIYGHLRAVLGGFRPARLRLRVAP